MVTKSKNPVVATTAGAVAGVIETLLVWPMEMIKTNLQLGTMRAQYTCMVGGFRYHVQADGAGSLYRGLAPVLVGTIPKAGIRFGAYDVMKRALAGENGEVSTVRNLAAGTIAGGVEAALAMTPVETLKTKLIGANVGVWEGTRMILAREGFLGLYQGLSATILKQSSNQGLRFMCFSEFQKHINPEFLERHGLIRDAQNMTGGQRALLGLLGGMTAGLISVFGNNRTTGAAIYEHARLLPPVASERRNPFLLLWGGPSTWTSGPGPRRDFHVVRQHHAVRIAARRDLKRST
ncbi:hypothetical protein ON010_g2135 [Phytophthora cinnamomi]|nr:hypothetical protein ON010_g2135 [Phytophthora cinnamomi]